ncbi:F-type H+-transporting ATPase subunit b [Desulfacinum hydrothermale DSM 13146]|uniref:ATP synthase subunit b n=1 Tax=Desulfacinum hydrothermale DSM 13146 TaxID=1121390 RepID=A0A1W1XVL2_9BACT|nr:hypothetical protein [Desulfacinum hydrothermale]SMC27999.1 F-type H+-transporting ATPase subunit b [Desulfacinum hydrothermale DSM 13146]
MINIDVTLLIQMANFLLLLFLMNLVLYRPIRRLVAQRNELVAQQRESIDQAHSTAEAAVKEFEDKLKAAREVGRRKVQELKDGAYQYEKELLEKANREAAQEVQAVRDKVRDEIGAVRAELERQIQDFSREMAQRILGRSL